MNFEQQSIPGCFLDFGTDVSWIASKELCQMNQCSFNSSGYSPIESTRGATEKIAFGAVSGAYYTDNWNFMDRKLNIPIMVVQSASINWSCRLSLGLKSQILWKLKYEKVLDSNTITFQSIDDAQGARIVWGGYDENRINGTFTWLPVSIESKWAVPMNFIGSTGFNMSLFLDLNFFATFNDFSFLPVDIATLLHESMGMTLVNGTFHNSLAWAVNCSQALTLSDITLSLGAFNLTLTPAEYIYPTIYQNNRICISSILGVPKNQDIPPSLGSITLQNYMMAFDFENNQIGISRALISASIPSSLKPLSAPFKVKFAYGNIVPDWIIVISVIVSVLFISGLFILCFRFCNCTALKKGKDFLFIRQTPTLVILPGPFNDNKEDLLEKIDSANNSRNNSPTSPEKPDVFSAMNARGVGRSISLTECRSDSEIEPGNPYEFSENLNQIHGRPSMDPSQNLNNIVVVRHHFDTL